MLLREITAKEDKQQLNELFFIPVAAAVLIGKALLANFVLGVAFDFALGMTKDWLNSKAIRNFIPTGSHIPNHTEIVDGKNRYIYKEDSKAWFKAAGKTGTDVTGNAVPFNKAVFKNAILNKKMKFLDKAAVMITMQSMNIPGANGDPQFSKTGTTLKQVVQREKMGPSSKLLASLKKETKLKKQFGLKALGKLSFVLPVYAAYNTVTLLELYNYRLIQGNTEGFIDSITGKVYDDASYNRDVANLRAITATYVATYITAMGGPALAQGVIWTYLLFSPNKIEKYVKKATGGWGKIATVLKLTATGVGGVAVVASVNSEVAETLGKMVAESLIILGGRSGRSAGENWLLKPLFKYFDKDINNFMTKIGFGTVAATKNVMGKDLGKPEGPKFTIRPGDDTDTTDTDTTDTTDTTTGPISGRRELKPIEW